MPLIFLAQQHQYVDSASKHDGLPIEVRLVEVSKEIRTLARTHAEEAAAAAQDDEHEATILNFLVGTKSNKDVTDETLFRLLTACYTACLPDVERLACCMKLSWKDARLHVDCMVDFVRQELLSGQTPAFCNDASAQDEEVSQYVEDLWASFCHRRNIQVSPEGSVRTPFEMDMPILPPYRKLANGEFRWRCEEKESKSTTPSPLYRGGAKEFMPRFFDLADMIARSDHFHILPVDRLGWNMREFARKQTWVDLWDRVDRAYSQLAAARVSDCPPGWPDEYDSAPLLVKELKLLLEAMHNNKLLRSLAAQRPPLSVLTHHHALTICVLHARIWLARYDLKIYYDHSLTYAQLCTQASTEEEEEVVLRDAFCKERIPSWIEQVLRCKTLQLMCREDTDAEVMHIRPEDLEKFQEPGLTQPWWRGFMEHIRYPVLTCDLEDESKRVEDMATYFVSQLKYETKSKKGLSMLLSHVPPEIRDSDFRMNEVPV